MHEAFVTCFNLWSWLSLLMFCAASCAVSCASCFHDLRNRMNRTMPELCKENESPGSSVPWHNWQNWHTNSTSKAEQSRAKERMAGFVGFGHNCINCIRKHTNKFGVSNMSTGVSACCFPHRPTLAQRWYILAKTPGLMNVIWMCQSYHIVLFPISWLGSDVRRSKIISKGISAGHSKNACPIFWHLLLWNHLSQIHPSEEHMRNCMYYTLYHVLKFLCISNSWIGTEVLSHFVGMPALAGSVRLELIG